MTDLDNLRKEIDEVNVRIIDLLARRKEIAKKVGEYKQREGLPVTDPKREEILFEKVSKLAEEKGVDSEFVKELFERIIKEAKKEQ